jgi:hypothetical protein
MQTTSLSPNRIDFDESSPALPSLPSLHGRRISLAAPVDPAQAKSGLMKGKLLA